MLASTLAFDLHFSKLPPITIREIINLRKSLEGGKSYLGSPADESRKKFKEIAMLRILPKVIEKLED